MDFEIWKPEKLVIVWPKFALYWQKCIKADASLPVHMGEVNFL